MNSTPPATTPSKISIYGANTSASSSSTSYSSSHTIAQNALALIGDKLLINLGYIINNQTIVSSSKFATASAYNVELFITQLSIDGIAFTDSIDIQINKEQNVTIESGTKIIGNLVIGN